jgi:hypothetical protein
MVTAETKIINDHVRTDGAPIRDLYRLQERVDCVRMTLMDEAVKAALDNPQEATVEQTYLPDEMVVIVDLDP